VHGVNVLETSINAISIAWLQAVVQYHLIIVVKSHRLPQQKHAAPSNKHIQGIGNTNGLLLTYKLITLNTIY